MGDTLFLTSLQNLTDKDIVFTTINGSTSDSFTLPKSSIIKGPNSGVPFGVTITNGAVTARPHTYITPQATQAEMEAGTEAEVRSMSPENIKQAIRSLGDQLLQSDTYVIAPSSNVNESLYNLLPSNISSYSNISLIIINHNAYAEEDVINIDVDFALFGTSVTFNSVQNFTDKDIVFTTINGSSTSESLTLPKGFLYQPSNNPPNTPSNVFLTSGVIAKLTTARPFALTKQATQAEMEAGTETEIRSMSPENIKQAIDALSSDAIGWEVMTGDTILESNGKYLFLPNELNQPLPS